MTKRVKSVCERMYAIRVWPYSQPYLVLGENGSTPALFLGREAARIFIGQRAWERGAKPTIVPIDLYVPGEAE